MRIPITAAAVGVFLFVQTALAQQATAPEPVIKRYLAVGGVQVLTAQTGPADEFATTDSLELRHTATNYVCPVAPPETDYKLMLADAFSTKDKLTCLYRLSKDLEFPQDYPAAMVFSVDIIQDPEPAAAAHKGFSDNYRRTTKGTADRPPALGPGVSPLPSHARAWLGDKDQAYGVWTSRHGKRLIVVRGRYAADAEGEVAAGKLARAVFEAATQIQ